MTKEEALDQTVEDLGLPYLCVDDLRSLAYWDGWYYYVASDDLTSHTTTYSDEEWDWVERGFAEARDHYGLA